MLITRVISGDITKMSTTVDAIATLVNSEGLWLSGVDMAIKKNCGHRYHNILSRKLESINDDEEQTQDGKVYIIKGEGQLQNQTFKDVIFIIDNLNLRLPDLVFNILKEAHLAGYNSIAISPLRINVTSDPNDQLRSVMETKLGIFNFKNQYPGSNIMLYIVVYNDPALQTITRDNI